MTEMALHVGLCHGGPLDGREMVSRYPKGFLLADKSTGRAWLYDWRDNAFHLREPGERQLDGDRAVQAALGDEYDVVALPKGVGDGRP
jgi:hypothetical protein